MTTAHCRPRFAPRGNASACAVFAFLCAAFLAACASGPELPPLQAPDALFIPEPQRAPIGPVSEADALDLRQQELLDLFTDRTFVPTAWSDEQLGPMRAFARVVDLIDGRFGAPRRHLVVIAEGPWLDDHIRAVITQLYALPGSTDGAPVLIHFDSDEPVPFALRYRFGNAWYGRLESALYVALAEPAGDAPVPGVYVERARAALSDFGLVFDDERVDALDELDRLLAALPRPDEDGGAFDLPQATVLGVGLVLGDELTRRLRGVDWAPADETMADYYGLTVRDDPQTMLRPIDFAQLAWQTRLDAPIRAYADLVAERLELARESR